MTFKKPRRKVSKVFIHCSASDKIEHDSVAVITAWHLARGFSTIGYHYVIAKDGVAHTGRDLNRSPAAQKGHNEDTIAICVTGLKIFNALQMRALLNLCIDIDDAYRLEGITFHGHCEVNPDKTCPVFEYKSVLRLQLDGAMQWC